MGKKGRGEGREVEGKDKGVMKKERVIKNWKG